MSHNFIITASNDGTRRFNNRGGVGKGRRYPKSFNNRGPVNPDLVRKLLDSDVTMDGGQPTGHQSSSYNNNQNRNYRGNNRRGNGRQLMVRENISALKRLGLNVNVNNHSSTKQDWYLITILHARDLDKNFILQSITSSSKVPFVPINFSKDGNTATFYVKTKMEASAIGSLHKVISTPSGHKMIIISRATEAPATRVTDEVTEMIKNVMSRRYDTESGTLYLSDFVKDQEFIEKDILLTMNRPQVVLSILDIIAKNIPNLKAIDLSNNNLINLDFFLKLHEKAPNITKINLANNKLKSDRDIFNLGKLPIVELILDGNPLQDRYKEKQKYISFVRKCFPKVIKLDNQILPSPITFEVEAIALPESKGSFFENSGVQDQICIFLQQYFNFYDSDNRKNLMGAYHDKAVFSLTANYNKYSSSRQSNLGDYFAHSRNSRNGNSNVEQDKVIVGREGIISLLLKLPSTKHDLKKLLVDTKFISPSMLLISLNGVFKEAKNNPNSSPSFRTFSKVLVTVPNGPGIAIINEMLNISCLPFDQNKNYFTDDLSSSNVDPKVLENLPKNSSTSNLLPVVGSVPSADVMTAMVRQLSAVTRMNEKYSNMCLSENNWDYQQAMSKFTILHQNNSIPQEAFL